MAESKTEEVAQDQDDKGTGSITDFLKAPRKKRKNYVILALGDQFDIDLSNSIDGFVKKTFNTLATSMPTTARELARQFGRNISLLVINDEFTDPIEVMELVVGLKRKRHTEVIPVLFMTRNPQRLVEYYHQYLLEYQESDEFIYYPGVSRNQIFSRIRNGIETKNKRRSRRYKIDRTVSFYHLEKDKTIPGRFLDLSVHGALLKAESECLFKIGDQLRVNIPVGTILNGEKGDFLKLAAKVRRVYISGEMAGVSFEYLSESQIYCFTRFLTSTVSKEMERRSLAFKPTAPQR
jgi:uncharacterized protein (UPF0248 family)